MDNFEKFFIENRLRFDTEDLDASFINKITVSGRQQKRRKTVSRIYAVTSIIAILVLAVLLYLSPNGTTPAGYKSGLFSKIATDLVKEEDSYIKLISFSVSEINKLSIPAECEPIFKEFTQQLQIIDGQYEIYKAQVEKSGYNDEIIQQIVYNYQLKLSVLRSFQSEINKINNLSNLKSHDSEKIQINL